MTTIQNSAATTELLPLESTIAPPIQSELVDVLREAHANETAVYPLGGETSLDFGLPATVKGRGLSLAQLTKVIDYPHRDMTITVEAGITMRALEETLAQHGQYLPIDVPQSDRATLGGVVSTNWNGSRRYGRGTVRDHVIGISAVDGTGSEFRGGGRVVKNVAGYDFCKLLTGSLGTLGVISQLTLKLSPRPHRSTFVVCAIETLEQIDSLLAGTITSPVTPSAVEWLIGPDWQEDGLPSIIGCESPPYGCLAVALEGTEPEVSWMVDQIQSQWDTLGIDQPRVTTDEETAQIWSRLNEFSVAGESPLVIKANVVPSATVRFAEQALKQDANCSIQAHAGNGVLIVKFSGFPAEGLSRALAGGLLPAASEAHGNVTILSNPGKSEMTRQSVWGGIETPYWLMERVKRKFDPLNILNPGRFVYP